MLRRHLFHAIVASILLVHAALAQPPRRGSAQPDAQPPEQQRGRYEVATAAEEKVSQTSHAIRLDGREIKYTATTGTVPIRLEDGKVAARMFFVAYMKDGEEFQPAPPYELVDNPNSLIDVSDLVFVDAIDTGFSRVVAGVENAQFHGQEGDIRAFGLFIKEYLTA